MSERPGRRSPSRRAERWLRSVASRRPSVKYWIGDLREEFDEMSRENPLRAWLWHWAQTLSLVFRFGVARCFAPFLHPSPPPNRRRETAFNSVLTDVRFAFRALRKRPLLTAAATVTLALGVGPTTSVFSIVKGVLLEPLPFPEPNELVFLWTMTGRSGERHNNSGPNVLDWQGEADFFEGIYAFINEEVVLTNLTGPRERLPVLRATHEILDVLGLRPSLGRGLRPDDVGPGRPPVVVLGHRFWMRRFGADKATPLGETLILSGRPHEVVGVLPPDVNVPMAEHAELLLPIDFDLDERPRHLVYLGAAARLREGVSHTQARDGMERLHAAIRETHPATLAGTSIAIVPFAEQIAGDVKPTLLILLAGTMLLVLLGCTNVANLWLARGAEREAEIALRLALGASRTRLGRLVVAESFLVALAGGTLGIGLSVVALRGLLVLAPSLPRGDAIDVDVGVLGFALLLSLLTGVLSGAAPVLAARAAGVRSTRATGGGGGLGSPGVRRARKGLVVAQCAVTTVLLVGAGLLSHSFSRLLAVDPGYQVRNVMTAAIDLPPDAYTDPASRARLFEELARGARALLGVTAAGVTLIPPLEETRVNFGVQVEGRDRGEPGTEPSADLGIASRGYFEALQIPLRSGRLFDEADRIGGVKVCLVSELLAERLWPDGDALGKRIDLVAGDWEAEPDWLVIVGVVADVKQLAPSDFERPFLYLPVSQRPQMRGSLVLRSDAGLDARALAPAVRELVRSVDGRLPVPQAATMLERLNRTVAPARFRSTLLSVLGAVALVVAASGIYALLSYMVASRTAEIGVRVSFGARGSDILRLLLGEGMGLGALGVVLGLLVAAGSGRVMERFLFGVSSHDILTFSVVPAILLAVVFLACLFPSLKASRLDTAAALRRTP